MSVSPLNAARWRGVAPFLSTMHGEAPAESSTRTISLKKDGGCNMWTGDYKNLRNMLLIMQPKIIIIQAFSQLCWGRLPF